MTTLADAKDMVLTYDNELRRAEEVRARVARNRAEYIRRLPPDVRRQLVEDGMLFREEVVMSEEVPREILEELAARFDTWSRGTGGFSSKDDDDSAHAKVHDALKAYRAAKAAAEPKLRTESERAADIVRAVMDDRLTWEQTREKLFELRDENVRPDPAPSPSRWRTGTKNPHTLYRDDEPAGFLLRPEHAAELLRAPEPDEPTVTWRGSVTDMATDLKAIISPRKIAKLAAELAPSAAPARCSGDR